MHRRNIDGLDPQHTYWVPAVTSPRRDWPGAPGCRRGARYLVNSATMHASLDEFETFETRSSCLQWIMRHRADLASSLPDAPIRAVRLDRWLLGLD